MESSTPTIITPPKATESEEAHIAVAVVWYPAPWTVPGHSILCHALIAGLRRKPVQIVGFGAYFKPIFSVSMITVNPVEKASALEAIKQTLAELKLLDMSTIAVRTAEAIWHTLHGIGVGGMTFDKAFLREEDIAAAKAEAEVTAAHAKSMWAAFIEDWKRNRPEESSDTDTK